MTGGAQQRLQIFVLFASFYRRSLELSDSCLAEALPQKKL
jgi:hypothetical protein